MSPSKRATGNLSPRMQGLPVHTAGSIVIRENVIMELCLKESHLASLHGHILALRRERAYGLIVPSGMVVSANVASSSLTSYRLAFKKFVRVRFARVRSAPRKLAPSASAPVRSAPTRKEPINSAPISRASTSAAHGS